jgi:hypothetical protein
VLSAGRQQSQHRDQAVTVIDDCVSVCARRYTNGAATQ